MDPELRDRVDKLPVWARQLIRNLQEQAEPNNVELRIMRQQVANADERVKRMRVRMDVMIELLTCAGRGGHETAQAYVDRLHRELDPQSDEG